jgi:hypothetical protein
MRIKENENITSTPISMEELLRSGHYGDDVVTVSETEAYVLRLLRVPPRPRKFMVLEAMAKRNLSLTDNEVVWKALTEFIKKTPEDSPCYIIVDVINMDSFTLSHLKHVASVMKENRAYLETRLMGSAVIVDYESSTDAFLAPMFKKLYTPVRPICWWAKDGDVCEFVREWESKLE